MVFSQVFKLACLGLACCLATSFAYADSSSDRERARSLFERIAGTNLNRSDPRLKVMTDLIRSGHLYEAGFIASQDPGMVAVRARFIGSKMSNRDRSSYVDLNDLTATFMGFVRDDLDARQLLFGNTKYQLTRSFDSANEMKPSAVVAELFPTEINPDELSRDEVAGIFHMSAWARAHYNAGTNRRPVKFAFEEFLCTPVESLRDFSLTTEYIRRDVTRIPSGRIQTFNDTCKGCHSGLDSISSAFAHVDYLNGRLSFQPGSVAAKMNRNAHNWPDGREVPNDSWVNLWTKNHNKKLGWRSPTSGRGVKQFGSMLAHSKAFSKCMAERIYREVCKSEASDSLKAELADGFEERDYQLRYLFIQSAISSSCEKRGEKPRVRRYDELVSSVARSLGIPENEVRSQANYETLKYQLPASEDIAQLNASSLLAFSKLATSTCRHFVETSLPSDTKMSFLTSRPVALLSEKDRRFYIRELALRLWKREPTKNEFKLLLKSFNELAARAMRVGARRRPFQFVCSLMLSSLENLMF